MDALSSRPPKQLRGLHVLKSALRLAMQVAFYLIDLLHEDNTEVVKAADQALTVISEVDESWGAKLRALRFEAHNQVWLEACANGAPQQVSFSRNALAIHPEIIRLAKQCLYTRGLCGASVHILRETECGHKWQEKRNNKEASRYWLSIVY